MWGIAEIRIELVLPLMRLKLRALPERRELNSLWRVEERDAS